MFGLSGLTLMRPSELRRSITGICKGSLLSYHSGEPLSTDFLTNSLDKNKYVSETISIPREENFQNLLPVFPYSRSPDREYLLLSSATSKFRVS